VIFDERRSRHGLNIKNIMSFIRENFLWFLEKREPKKKEVIHYTPDEIKDLPKQFREEFAKMAGELAAHKKVIHSIQKRQAEQFRIKEEILREAERLRQRDESTRISLDMLRKYRPAVFSVDGFYLGHYHSIWAHTVFCGQYRVPQGLAQGFYRAQSGNLG